jgi:hypothetical protein
MFNIDGASRASLAHQVGLMKDSRRELEKGVGARRRSTLQVNQKVSVGVSSMASRNRRGLSRLLLMADDSFKVE